MPVSERGLLRLAGESVPNADRSIEAGRGQTRAVGAPRDRGHLRRVPLEDVDLLRRGDVPDADGAITAGRGQPTSVGTPTNRIHRYPMPAQDSPLPLSLL